MLFYRYRPGSPARSPKKHSIGRSIPNKAYKLAPTRPTYGRASRLLWPSSRHCPVGIPSKPYIVWKTPQRRTVGICNAHLLELHYELKLAVWLESSLQIKPASGMQPHRRQNGSGRPSTRSIPSQSAGAGLPNMPIASATKCASGSRHARLFRNWLF